MIFKKTYFLCTEKKNITGISFLFRKKFNGYLSEHKMHTYTHHDNATENCCILEIVLNSTEESLHSICSLDFLGGNIFGWKSSKNKVIFRNIKLYANNVALEQSYWVGLHFLHFSFPFVQNFMIKMLNLLLL